MKYYLDWGRKKHHSVITESNPNIQSLTWGEITPSRDDEIYLEKGCPKWALYKLMTTGVRIFQCDGKEIKKLRNEMSVGEFIVEKSDINDVVLIQKLFLTKPSYFDELKLEDVTEFKLNYLTRRYRWLTNQLGRFKNAKGALESEHGPTELTSKMDELIKQFEKEKENVLKEASSLVEYEASRIKIKGVKTALITRLLSVAHPKDFTFLQYYLQYCGRTKFSRKSHKFSRDASGDAYYMAHETIMTKDPTFYPLYLKIKADLKAKYPDYWAKKINGMAINRLSTHILKYIYHTIRSFMRVFGEICVMIKEDRVMFRTPAKNFFTTLNLNEEENCKKIIGLLKEKDVKIPKGFVKELHEFYLQRGGNV